MGFVGGQGKMLPQRLVPTLLLIFVEGVTAPTAPSSSRNLQEQVV